MNDQEPQTPFVRWLHAQKNGDTSRDMPYARIYQWGKVIHTIIGADGRFNSEQIANAMALQGASEDDLAALVSAEAAWRVDTLIDTAEEKGVTIKMPSDPESDVAKALATPDAAMMCGYRNHRGEGCTDAAIPGAGRCGKHGGDITNPEVRRSFLLVSFAKVFDGARIAVEALIDEAENGRGMARVQAAKELLDRAGVAQDQHVHIHQPGEAVSEDDQVEELRRRLNVATDRLRIQAVPMSPEDGLFDLPEDQQLALPPASTLDDEIVDAEVIGGT